VHEREILGKSYNQVTRQYARLFRSLCNVQELESYIAFLVQVGERFLSDESSWSMLVKSGLSPATQWSIVDAFLGKITFPKIKDFLKIMVDNGRLSELSDVVELLVDGGGKRGNLNRVRYVSATPLTKEQKTHFKDILKERFGNAFSLNCVESASLGPGFMLVYENRLWDYSLRTYLGQLERHLTYTEG
jgi:F0F1-type ATP synthase delta subunit